MRSPRSRRGVAVPEASTVSPAMEAILLRVDQLSGKGRLYPTRAL